jgi:hypothetical protein
MKTVRSNWDNHTNKALGVHSIGQYMKVVPSSWHTSTNKTFRILSINQYMKVVFQVGTIIQIKFLECSRLANR